MPTWSFPHLVFPQAAWALLFIPFVYLLWWYASRQRRNVLRHWNDAALLPPRRWLGRMLLVQITLTLILALTGPELGTTTITPTTSARDLLLIIDISQSMLAEDQPPLSRLTRAKRYALQLIDYLNTSHATTRVGLAVFAGNARLLCPPTEDRDHLAQLIRDLTPDSLGTQSRITEANGLSIGTSFGSVARLLVEWNLSDPTARDFTDYLIISDGDDLTGKIDTAPFTNAGLQIHAMAVGDPTLDWPIPQGNSYLMMTDPQTGLTQRAVTRRQDAVLKTLTDATTGTLIVEDNSPAPVVTWWQGAVSQRPTRPLQSQARQMPTNQAGWILGLAGIFMLMELGYGGARRREW
ncbi:MAG TPA: VWA domain-containing protein [Gemmatales bacterium]|nr:VWA domain-containing protein [Gemmatales bacterium]